MLELGSRPPNGSSRWRCSRVSCKVKRWGRIPYPSFCLAMPWGRKEEKAIAASRLESGGWRRITRAAFARVYPRAAVTAGCLAAALGILGTGIAPAAPPDSPAATPKMARERAEQAVAAALVEVRSLRERTPKMPEKPLCDLMQREEEFLHVVGQRPRRAMSVAAVLGSAASTMGWTWSHALPGSLLYMDLDFGPARKRMTGAEMLCAVDEKTAGVLRLQMYPGSKHLFVGEALEVQ